MKKNNEEKEEEKKPSKISLFFLYYKNVPAFKALIKLALYFIFFAVIISVVACNQDTIKQMDEKDKVEEKEKTSLTYKEMLDALLASDLKITYNIIVNDTEYRIDANYQEKSLSGMFRTVNEIHEFKIKDDIVYEITLNEEKENMELLNNINLTYLLPDALITYLESNKATKMLSEGNTIYNYDIDATKYAVITTDDWINKIEITNELFKYVIEYNKSEVE